MIATAISDKIKLYLPLKPNTKAQLAALIPDARWQTLPYATRKAVVRRALDYDRRLNAVDEAFQVKRYNLEAGYREELYRLQHGLMDTCFGESVNFEAGVAFEIDEWEDDSRF